MISACMIVKNEQDLLGQCLESIKSWIDEIIIVDTGSTDNTVKIAESYGAKVYYHEWQNDFSLHRNQSIGYANGDWIFIIDADEVVRSDMSEFKDRLSLIPDNISALVVRVFETGDSTSWLGVRFFRKSSNPTYHGIVHNKVRYDGGCAATDVEMVHHGYSLSPEKMAKKRIRTESLLLERLKQNEDDHAAHYYMTQLKVGEKNFNKAEYHGLRFFKCVPCGPEDMQFYSVMYFYMAWIYLNNGNGNRAVDWALKGLEFYPNDLDLNYIMARIGYQARRKEWVDLYGGKFLSILDNKNKKELIDKFESEIDTDLFNNRTIYTENSKEDILRFMNDKS